MDIEQLFEKYKPLLKQNLLPVSLGFLGLIFFIYGLITLLFSASNKATPETLTESISVSPAPAKQIVVDVEGAVVHPSVYHLQKDARIQDALVAAGGLSEEADRTWVAKNINLAQPLKDGVKVYVPFQVENYGGESTQGSLININTASASELDSLSGIGQATAQKIIDNRPYLAIEDLLSKKAVGSSVFEKIREKISVF